MMKFTVMAAAIIVALSAMLVSAAGVPKAHQLSSSYTYEQYLRDVRKARPTSSAEFSSRKQLFEAVPHHALGDLERLGGEAEREHGVRERVVDTFEGVDERAI